MSAAGRGHTRVCDCCGQRKCNKIYRMPVGTPTKKIVRVCGRCVIHNGRKTREWLDKQEEDLK